MCKEYGTSGFVVQPPEHTVLTVVAEDPEKAWAQIGPDLFEEASTYASWQTPDITSAVHSHATSVEELRKENIYEIVTPEECIANSKERGSVVLHPLCGGISPDVAWTCMTLYAEKVLPALK